MTLKKIIDVSLIVVLGGLFLLTTVVSWYRLVVHEDFTYFTSEEDVPDRFDFSTY